MRPFVTQPRFCSHRVCSDEPPSECHNTFRRKGARQVGRSLLLSHIIVSSRELRQAYKPRSLSISKLSNSVFTTGKYTVAMNMAASPSDVLLTVIYSRNQPEAVVRTPGNCEGRRAHGGFSGFGTYKIPPRSPPSRRTDQPTLE